MIRFSANLGYLWKDLPLPQAIRRASVAGFDAVECHEPYAFDPAEVRAALDETGLSMVCLNTFTGGNGAFGLAALPERVDDARAAIDQAIAYADAIDAAAVSVVAGNSGRTPESEQVYRANLAYAAERAAASGRRILIEPLNSVTFPEYHLITTAAGIETVEAIGAPNLGLMVDTFHASTMETDPLVEVFHRAAPYLGHVQISAFPDRGEPDRGDIDFAALLPAIAALGYDGVFGAEYVPRSSEEAGLGWLAHWHRQRPAADGQPSIDEQGD